MRTSALLLLLLLAGSVSVSSSVAGDSANPAWTGAISPQPPPTDAQTLTLYTNLALWQAAAGANRTLINFEQYAHGTRITDQLPCITLVSGTFQGAPTSQFVYSSANLPFPMFTAGTLPSEPNFLSNLIDPPVFATGTITFAMAGPTTAIGAFVADGSPLGDFNIEVFAGQQSLGTVTSPPRTLPDSFIGVVSTGSFDRATFYATSAGDSWGLDNLEHNCAGATPVAASTWGQIKAQYE